ncbi:hypothetical protein TNCV_3411361 [Trichonephila clavipes]|nr:hypothetical protein TNCV_3411361 [Trichonephila clavipes]
MLTAGSYGLGSNSEEDMSSRVVGGSGREVGGPCLPKRFSPSKLVGAEQNRTVTCVMLKAKANDKRKNSSPYPRLISWASV